MNVILYLNEPQAISMYITDVLKFPAPVTCMHISELNESYMKLRPAIIITEVTIINDKYLGSELANVINTDVRCRKIVLSGKPIVGIENKELIINDKETTCKLQRAIQFYLEEPDRLLYSVCLVGVKYAEYVGKLESPIDLSKEPMAAIKKLRSFDDIKWGQFYVVIDQKHNQQFRRIYPSPKKDYYTLKIDRQLTPNEFKSKPVTTEMAVADILAILGIVAEIRSF
jgi:hypothetical protein